VVDGRHSRRGAGRGVLLVSRVGVGVEHRARGPEPRGHLRDDRRLNWRLASARVYSTISSPYVYAPQLSYAFCLTFVIESYADDYQPRLHCISFERTQSLRIRRSSCSRYNSSYWRVL
jgi:hypothetical protein